MDEMNLLMMKFYGITLEDVAARIQK